MLRELARSLILIFAVGLGLTVTGRLAGVLVSPRGDAAPSLLMSGSIPLALVVVLVAVAFSVALACLVARTSNTATGAFALGGCMYGFAWRSGGADAFALIGNASYGVLAGEMVLWLLLAIAAAVALFRFGGPLPDVAADPRGRTPHPLVSPEALRGGVAAVASLAAIWLLARSADRGQALLACVGGGIAAGTVGRLISPHVQPVLVLALPPLFGGLAYAICGVLIGERPLADLALAGTLPPLGRVMPADVFVGAFAGGGMGLGIAKSFLQEAPQDAAPEGAVVRRPAPGAR
ncbi:MAG: hypothetical protein KF817_14385 [Phycisphaeraceae bacterium]|nr:hypothetical protein [Phycisphaeraceae bacterium]